MVYETIFSGRPQNDLLCVEWDIKHYSLFHYIECSMYIESWLFTFLQFK